MDDLRPLLERTASDLEPEPDGWGRVEDRRRRHQRARRLTAAVVALVVAGAGLTVAALAIHPSTKPALPLGRPSPTAPNHPITVTLHADGYPATCTATVANSNVAPGDAMSVAFVVRNGGDETLQTSRGDPFGEGFGRLRVHDAAGRMLFDTETRHLGQSGPGPIPPVPLRPGASMLVSSESVVVRWAGPLALAGSCPTPTRSVSGRDRPVRFPRLPEFRLAVVPQGPTPSDAVAIDRAVAATAGLYDACHPGGDGELVAGVLRPPEVAGDQPKVQPLPLGATCWAVITPGPGFSDVTLYFASPPTRSAEAPSGPAGLPPIGPGRPAESGRWEVVVLPESAVTVESPISAGRSGPEGDVGYDLNTDNGQWELGGLSCVGESFAGGAVHLFPPPGHHACNPHP